MLHGPESSQDVLRLQPLGRRLDARGSRTSAIAVPTTVEAVSLAAQSHYTTTCECDPEVQLQKDHCYRHFQPWYLCRKSLPSPDLR